MISMPWPAGSRKYSPWPLSLPPVQDEEELGGRLAGKPAEEAESGRQRDAPAPGRDRERPGGLDRRPIPSGQDRDHYRGALSDAKPGNRSRGHVPGAVDRANRGPGGGRGPVSYTHLTLPTIYS